MAVHRVIVRHRASSHRLAPEMFTMVDEMVADLAGAGARQVKSTTSHRVVELPEDDLMALAFQRPDLIVEVDQPIELFGMPGLPPMAPATTDASLHFRVVDSEGKPIADTTIFVVGASVGFRGETDKDGELEIEVDPIGLSHVIVSPRANYWSKVIPQPPAADDGHIEEVVLSELNAPDAMQWIHRLVGAASTGPRPTGAGVTVAVVDSGIAAVPALTVADGLNTLDDAPSTQTGWDNDENGHGTHCAGIIAGRPSATSAFAGIAPDATLFSLKVFPGGFISDLIEAVDWCRDRRIDLVNMSLGSRVWSHALSHALMQATNAGVTVIAATGNDGSSVSFPASHPDVIAVGAIGRTGSFPADSAHMLKIGSEFDWRGELFSASFTNFGPEVAVAAPGVAVPSTVPTGFAAWDGTSMACPLVTGLLALALEHNPGLRSIGRVQTARLRWIIETAAVDMGMTSDVQGHGLPTVWRVLQAASLL